MICVYWTCIVMDFVTLWPMNSCVVGCINRYVTHRTDTKLSLCTGWRSLKTGTDILECHPDISRIDCEAPLTERERERVTREDVDHGNPAESQQRPIHRQVWKMRNTVNTILLIFIVRVGLQHLRFNRHDLTLSHYRQTHSFSFEEIEWFVSEN